MKFLRITQYFQFRIRDASSLGSNRNIASRTALTLLGLSAAILLTSCSNSANRVTATVEINHVTATDEMLYLAPIPKETLDAFRAGTPIANELQAVIAARVYLGSTRLLFTTSPKVISVVEDPPGVWRVVFEGELQVIPPDPEHTFTPPPPTHGCVYVMIYTNENDRAEIGTIGCPC